ncbi:hypothetical protein BGZ80_003337 [Entomortierella chlamydospora]|uniref:Uncharacterized protein n=1 Tax=Entomortierella chlamydospora TaxID=101097 RepID=A0A9P6T313_9FUNG|nr:hypothetical protein BGZ80_003337 [Entomortierella chlamydospora]
MSSSRRNSKQITPEEESAMQGVKSPEPPKLKLKVKQPEQATLSESEVKKMFVAVEESDIKTLKHYLSQKNVHPDTLFTTNIFDESTFTWSALHAAAYYGSKQVVNLLMEYGANVELEDTWYKGRPLAWAAFGGHLDVAKLLIEKYGADKKAKNEHGQVALELVYELTPEWETMFAETHSNGSRSGKPSKLKKSGDEPKTHHKDGRSMKDGKEGKNTVTIPASPQIGAFTELYKLILNHKDKTGRELADIFLALPSKEEYPEYYEIIKSPMSLQLVLSRIKSGHYKTVEDFDREFQLIFENALIFNEDTSRINKDARVLLKLFNTRKKDIYAAYKLVENPKASAADKGDRQKVSTHTKGGVTFQAGEFVQLSDPARTIILIERLEVDSRKNRFIAGSKFLRPEQTLQVPGQTFYEKEVLKTSGEWEFDFALVDHKVYVQAHKDYVRGRAINFDPSDVYVCENRYSETGKSAFLIKDWKRVYSLDPLPTPVQPYPSPLKLPKFRVKSTVTGDTTLDTVGQFNGRRASSAAHTDASKRNKRPRSSTRSKPASKRRQSRSAGNSDDDDDEEDEDDEDEDEDVDVDGVTSPDPQRRRSSHQQRQQMQQAQHLQQHQQFQPQLPQQHQQQFQQQQQFAQQQHQLQHQQHSRRVSSQMNNPNPIQQQQLLMQQQQQQQQQHLYQQQQAIQYQQMHPHLQHPHQPGIPQSPSSSQTIVSPGSPNRLQMQMPMGAPMIDSRTGMMLQAPPPPPTMTPFTPVEPSLVYDPNIGPRKGYAMLKSISLDSEDKSFMMSLSTETFAYSAAVHNHVSTITLAPQLAPQLIPIHQQVGLSVFQNGRKLAPSSLQPIPSSPTVGQNVYTIPLVSGQNIIDIWISAQVGALFQGGGPGGKTETQQFYLFIQRNSPKQVQDIKQFLEIARRKDAKSGRIKKNGSQTKFKVRCSRYLYTLVINDAAKAEKLKQSLPPTLLIENIKN